MQPKAWMWWIARRAQRGICTAWLWAGRRRRPSRARPAFLNTGWWCGLKGADDPRLRKGLGDWAAREAAWAWARGEAASGVVFLENDLSAHANPTRMALIACAAEDLSGRLASCCPARSAPGYAVRERIPGLPCADCGAPMRKPRAKVWGCRNYAWREELRLNREPADPGRCDWCNP